MIKYSIAAAALVSLAACNSGTKTGNNMAAANSANQNAAAPAASAPANNSSSAGAQNAQSPVSQAAVPANFDWVMDVHGGSADITFGDGDIAEGESLLSLACLPGSNRTEPSWIEEGPATLRSGSASADLQAGASLPLDHPVLQAWRSSGEIALVRNGQEQRLAAKKPGREVIADFVDYCSKPAAQQR
jgi:hypothetical protein